MNSHLIVQFLSFTRCVSIPTGAMAWKPLEEDDALLVSSLLELLPAGGDGAAGEGEGEEAPHGWKQRS